jgi:hypothetical protein
VRRALEDELRNDTAQIGTRAENLLAIAELYEIAIEDLVLWIHVNVPQKQWTSAEFRRWAQKFSADRARLLQLRENDPFRQLCPSCRTAVAHRVGNVLRCAQCGEMPVESTHGDER